MLLARVQVLDQYNQGIEARNRMLELILPGKVVFLRPRKVGPVTLHPFRAQVTAVDVVQCSSISVKFEVK